MLLDPGNTKTEGILKTTTNCDSDRNVIEDVNPIIDVKSKPNSQKKM